MAKRTTNPTTELPSTVNANVLAALLNVSVVMIGKWAATGVVVKVGPGKYRLRDSVHNVLKQARGRETTAAQREELLAWTAARRRRAEFELERRSGAYVSIPDAVAGMTESFVIVRNRLLSMGSKLAARFAPRVPPAEAKDIIDSEVNDVLTELSDERIDEIVEDGRAAALEAADA